MLLNVYVIDCASRAVIATRHVDAQTVGALERRLQGLQREYGDHVLIDDSTADAAVRRLQGLPPCRIYGTRDCGARGPQPL